MNTATHNPSTAATDSRRKTESERSPAAFESLPVLVRLPRLSSEPAPQPIAAAVESETDAPKTNQRAQIPVSPSPSSSADADAGCQMATPARSPATPHAPLVFSTFGSPWVRFTPPRWATRTAVALALFAVVAIAFSLLRGPSPGLGPIAGDPLLLDIAKSPDGVAPRQDVRAQPSPLAATTSAPRAGEGANDAGKTARPSIYTPVTASRNDGRPVDSVRHPSTAPVAMEVAAESKPRHDKTPAPPTGVASAKPSARHVAVTPPVESPLIPNHDRSESAEQAAAAAAGLPLAAAQETSPIGGASPQMASTLSSGPSSSNEPSPCLAASEADREVRRANGYPVTDPATFQYPIDCHQRLLAQREGSLGGFQGASQTGRSPDTQATDGPAFSEPPPSNARLGPRIAPPPIR